MSSGWWRIPARASWSISVVQLLDRGALTQEITAILYFQRRLLVGRTFQFEERLYVIDMCLASTLCSSRLAT